MIGQQHGNQSTPTIMAGLEPAVFGSEIQRLSIGPHDFFQIIIDGDGIDGVVSNFRLISGTLE